MNPWNSNLKLYFGNLNSMQYAQMFPFIKPFYQLFDSSIKHSRPWKVSNWLLNALISKETFICRSLNLRKFLSSVFDSQEVWVRNQYVKQFFEASFNSKKYFQILMYKSFQMKISDVSKTLIKLRNAWTKRITSPLRTYSLHISNI